LGCQYRTPLERNEIFQQSGTQKKSGGLALSGSGAGQLMMPHNEGDITMCCRWPLDYEVEDQTQYLGLCSNRTAKARYGEKASADGIPGRGDGNFFRTAKADWRHLSHTSHKHDRNRTEARGENISRESTAAGGKNEATGVPVDCHQNLLRT
jgi:hypothetical protein